MAVKCGTPGDGDAVGIPGDGGNLATRRGDGDGALDINVIAVGGLSVGGTHDAGDSAVARVEGDGTRFTGGLKRYTPGREGGTRTRGEDVVDADSGGGINPDFPCRCHDLVSVFAL